MRKKIVLLITALALSAVMVVGGTLAYLADHTETLENIMKFDSGGDGSDTAISIEIAEPTWTPGIDANGNLVTRANESTVRYQWNDAVANADGTPNGTAITVPATNKVVKGQTLWGIQQPFYDGAIIDKEVVVANNSNVDAYVGVAITLPQDVLFGEFDANGNGVLGTEYGLSWAEFDQIAELYRTKDDVIYEHGSGLKGLDLTELWDQPYVAGHQDCNWILTRLTRDTRYFTYADKLHGKNGVTKGLLDRRKENDGDPNLSISNRLFHIVHVRPTASQATFKDENGNPVMKKLRTPVVNPNYDSAYPNRKDANGNKVPQFLTETDNIMLVLRDNSGAPTDGNFAPTAESALQLSVRAYATQAEIETDYFIDRDTTIEKDRWNEYESNVAQLYDGPLYALDTVFPGVFYDEEQLESMGEYNWEREWEKQGLWYDWEGRR